MRGWLLLAPSEQGLDMLLTNFQCTGQPPPQEITQLQMSVVERLKNPDLTNVSQTPIMGFKASDLRPGIEDEH